MSNLVVWYLPNVVNHDQLTLGNLKQEVVTSQLDKEYENDEKTNENDFVWWWWWWWWWWWLLRINFNINDDDDNEMKNM